MIKSIVKKLLNNKTLPVINGSLKGVRLKINKLQKGSVLFKSYEPDKQLAFLAFIKPGYVFFDVGSNVGLHSYFVEKCIPNVKIYSFEPLPKNVEYIQETIANNKFKNIHLIESAVGSETKQIYFDIGSDNSMGSITDNKTSLIVNLTTLDVFTRDINILPDVIKIDVEGAEGDVLMGSINLIQNKLPIFIIELHNPKQDIFVSKFLIEKNYEIFRLNDKATKATDKLLLHIKNKQSSWPDPDGVFGNIVAIHKSKMLAEYSNLIA